MAAWVVGGHGQQSGARVFYSLCMSSGVVDPRKMPKGLKALTPALLVQGEDCLKRTWFTARSHFIKSVPSVLGDFFCVLMI